VDSAGAPRCFCLGSTFAAGTNVLKLLVGQVLYADEIVLRSADTNEFVKFHLDRGSVSVLGILDEKDHQEGNDSGACVDDELPGIGKLKQRPADRPDKDGSQGKGEDPGSSYLPRGDVRDLGKNSARRLLWLERVPANLCARVRAIVGPELSGHGQVFLCERHPATKRMDELKVPAMSGAWALPRQMPASSSNA
jgi:hypothetical protein